jgi:D-amino-acid oxidase
VTDVAVLGSGIIGLWTAEVLAEAGHRVTVLSRTDAVSSTSAAAAAVLVPLLPGDPTSLPFQRGVRWADETLWHVQAHEADHKAIELMPCFEFGVRETVEYGFALKNLTHLAFSEFLIVELAAPVAGFDVALKFDCHLCHSRVYLEWLSARLADAGVAFRSLSIRSRADLTVLDQPVVFNCLGYQRIFEDDELVPVLGQSIYIEARTSGGAFGLGAGPHAVFQHRRGFHIGAHFRPGDVASSPRRDLYEESVAFVADAFPRLCRSVGVSPPVLDLTAATRVNAGVRPLRASGPRVEVEVLGKKTVVHHYGHGAHGWTLGYGSALEAVRLSGV